MSKENIEELLRPRIKVIEDYPHSPYNVGDIIKPNKGRFVLTQTSHRDEFGETVYTEHMHNIKVAEQYPHLFIILEWWEERKLEEMPQYVKIVNEEITKDTGLYCKVHKWHIYGDIWPSIKGDYGAEIVGYMPDYLARIELNFPGQKYGRLNAAHLLPATREDYEAYVNK